MGAKKGEMLKELESNLQAGDLEVDIIGFSRGAVTAAAFAEAISELKKAKIHPFICVEEIRFMGLYDPVPGPGFHRKPQIPDLVKRVAIAYAMDERRSEFKQHIYTGGNITARSFRGAHSDIGGGYYHRGLANIALEWMIDQGGDPFKYPNPINSPSMVSHQERMLFYGTENLPQGIPRHNSVGMLDIMITLDSDVSLGGTDLSTHIFYYSLNGNPVYNYNVGDKRF